MKIIKKWDFLLERGINLLTTDKITIERKYVFYWINKGGVIRSGRRMYGDYLVTPNSYVHDYQIFPDGQILPVNLTRFRFEVRLKPMIYEYYFTPSTRDKLYFNPGSYDIRVLNIESNKSFVETVEIKNGNRN